MDWSLPKESYLKHVLEEEAKIKAGIIPAEEPPARSRQTQTKQEPQTSEDEEEEDEGEEEEEETEETEAKETKDKAAQPKTKSKFYWLYSSWCVWRIHFIPSMENLPSM